LKLKKLLKQLKKLTPNQIIIIFVVISLLIHGVVFLVLPQLIQVSSSKKNEEKVVWTKLKLPPQKPNQSLPIADIKKPENEKEPEKANVFSKYNQSVENETTGMNRKPANKSSDPNLKPKEKTSPPKKEENKKEKESKKEAPQKEEKPPEKKLPNPFEDLNKKEKPLIPSGFSDLNKTNRSSNQQYQMNGSEGDYLPGYKIGNETYVNAMANPNIAYFVELKNKFRLAWNPIPSIRSDPFFINQKRVYTILGFTINPKGNLVNVIVIKASGSKLYDEEAIRTIKDSAPFSTPPDFLLKNGKLNVSWQFTVDL
jgi:TonB family protein